MDKESEEVITPVLEADKFYQEILETYPFLTPREMIDYQEKAEKVLSSSADELTKAKQLVEFFNDPHTDWHEINGKEVTPVKPAKELTDGILYVKIPTFKEELVEGSMRELVDYCLENQDKIKGIVLDIRGNKGGNSNKAELFGSLFFEDCVPHGRLIRRIKGDGLREDERVLGKSYPEFLNTPLVILINRDCVSSTELFLASFKVTGRATLIGEETRGGSGNPVNLRYDFDGKHYLFRIPTWRFILRGESEPIEKTKIKPDIIYPAEGEAIIEFARQYLKGEARK